jgi:hypothetical protein
LFPRYMGLGTLAVAGTHQTLANPHPQLDGEIGTKRMGRRVREYFVPDLMERTPIAGVVMLSAIEDLWSASTQRAEVQNPIARHQVVNFVWEVTRLHQHWRRGNALLYLRSLRPRHSCSRTYRRTLDFASCNWSTGAGDHHTAFSELCRVWSDNT